MRQTARVPRRILATLALVVVTVVANPVPATAASPWPGTGQAAYAFGGGHVHRGPGTHVAPIASMAKMMTAYLVLRRYPMTHSGGFTMTVHSRDVADYQRRLGRGESVVAVRAGERLSERQALAALLLPSANNIAIMLARRVSGTVPRFVAGMNSAAHRFGMRETVYTDPSGFDARTRSTPRDQITLARKAMRLRTFRVMVGRRSFVVPVAGRVYNYDTLLGHDGFVGIKTGSMDQSGGCFVFAARRRHDGRAVMVYGAVMGQQGSDIIAAALDAARRLVRRVSTA